MRFFDCLLLLFGSLFVCVGTISAVADEVLPRNEKAVARVDAGQCDTAHATWWGFDPTDSTKSLQAAFKSRAKTILVEDPGTPWIVTTIDLPSDKEIILQDGVVIEAKRGEFLATSACLFSAKGCKNLTIRGTGATLRMHKADYHQPPYKLAEWRHTLSIRGCQNLTVVGVTLQESGGDGIYLGVGAENTTNRNITIRNVVCDGNNRQGISVITAENLLIEDCVFRNTGGTAPQAGIDFEPNRSTERLVNCVLRNCRSENNVGHAYHLYLGHLNEDSPPISIRFENCSSKGCQRYSTYVGIANREGLRSVRGSIDFVGCRFDADAGAGVYIRGNEADGCRVSFKQCEIIRRDTEKTRLAPITIEAPRRMDIDVGNIQIQDCSIRDSIIRQPIALIASPLSQLRKFSGNLDYESPAGRRAIELDTEQLDAWFPNRRKLVSIPRTEFEWREASPIKASSSASQPTDRIRLRRSATWLVWGQANSSCELITRIEPVGRHDPGIGVMTVTMTDGTTERLKPELRDGQLRFRFTPQTIDPIRLDWQGDSKETIRVVRCSAPLAKLGDSPGLDLFRTVATLQFVVPGNTEQFAILVAGSGAAETVKATIRDASGAIIEQKDNIAAPYVFVPKRKPNMPKEVWSLTLERASEGVLEDVSIQTLGIPPVFVAN